MGTDLSLSLMEPDSPLLQPLAMEAREEGYSFIERMTLEAQQGKNCFDKYGECFYGIHFNGELVGCGGINQDPYVDQPVGRLRHVYVLRKHRRRGIASFLVKSLLKRARSSFSLVRLRTPNKAADRFYEAYGFERVEDTSATHIFEFDRPV